MAGDYFELKARGTNVRTEVVAGVTTFLTMTYVIFLQPEILSEAGMDKNASIAVTCIISGLATLVTGLAANAPIAMAPGMGLNAFFAYSIVLGDGVRWETALGAVFCRGCFSFFLPLWGFAKNLWRRYRGVWSRR